MCYSNSTQRSSDAIAEIDQVTIQLDWYLFPIELQRVLPTVMQSTQKPVVMKCFGNILYSRKQFRKVSLVVLPPKIPYHSKFEKKT